MVLTDRVRPDTKERFSVAVRLQALYEGGEKMIIGIALGFNLLDFATGMVKGVKSDGGLNSTKLRDGLFKKVGFIFCYLLAFLINYAGHYIDLHIPVDLLPVICAYAILTETVSIIENISEINPDILPDVLKKLIGLGGETDA